MATASRESYRHALAVTGVRAGTDGTPYLYTLNFSCPQQLWPDLEAAFARGVESFRWVGVVAAAGGGCGGATAGRDAPPSAARAPQPPAAGCCRPRPSTWRPTRRPGASSEPPQLAEALPHPSTAPSEYLCNAARCSRLPAPALPGLFLAAAAAAARPGLAQPVRTCLQVVEGAVGGRSAEGRVGPRRLRALPAPKHVRADELCVAASLPHSSHHCCILQCPAARAARCCVPQSLTDARRGAARRGA